LAPLAARLATTAAMARASIGARPSAMNSGAASSISRHRLCDRVSALPFTSSVMALIIGTLTLSMPSVSASGNGARMCEASSTPSASLSRTLAHDTSRRISTSSPCRS